jgi:hypothetical protein
MSFAKPPPAVQLRGGFAFKLDLRRFERLGWVGGRLFLGEEAASGEFLPDNKNCLGACISTFTFCQGIKGL